MVRYNINHDLFLIVNHSEPLEALRFLSETKSDQYSPFVQALISWRWLIRHQHFQVKINEIQLYIMLNWVNYERVVSGKGDSVFGIWSWESTMTCISMIHKVPTLHHLRKVNRWLPRWTGCSRNRYWWIMKKKYWTVYRICSPETNRWRTLHLPNVRVFGVTLPS